MKTKQEQIEAMATILSNYCDKHNYDLHEPDIEDLAIELCNTGYGNVSEYKAEIERLEVETDERISEKFVDTFEERLETYNYGFSNGYSKGLSDSRTKIKQAQIDVLNKVMTYLNNKIENDYGDMADSVHYLTVDMDDFDDFTDELIKEIEK